MDFLGHVLSQEGVRPDLRKIELIKEWKNLISIKRVWLFLGLANFYRKFINDFFALVKPLTNLWKKEGSFEWKEE
jgi:flagellar biosynthesis protein FlhB